MLLTSEELGMVRRALPPMAGQPELDSLIRLVSSLKVAPPCLIFSGND